jgi:hypothetical protein
LRCKVRIIYEKLTPVRFYSVQPFMSLANEVIKKPAGGNWWAFLSKTLTIKPYPMKILLNVKHKNSN